MFDVIYIEKKIQQKNAWKFNEYSKQNRKNYNENIQNDFEKNAWYKNQLHIDWFEIWRFYQCNDDKINYKFDLQNDH